MPFNRLSEKQIHDVCWKFIQPNYRFIPLQGCFSQTMSYAITCSRDVLSFEILEILPIFQNGRISRISEITRKISDILLVLLVTSSTTSNESDSKILAVTPTLDAICKPHSMAAVILYFISKYKFNLENVTKM